MRRGWLLSWLAAGALLALTLQPIGPAVAEQLADDAPRAALVKFQTAPFPYTGTVPGSGAPFLNVNADGRLGHDTPRGGVYWADQSYSDNQVLLFLSRGFRLDRSAVMIVYFHGNGANLEEDVIDRQQVMQQVEDAGINAVLVAPQFAVDALDSSAGKFWEPGSFARFLDEASRHLADLDGTTGSAKAFSTLPVVLVAYSGGYNPAAYALTVGGARERIRGVVLLDAVFGEEDRFASFIEKDRHSAFFFSAYSASAADGNAELMAALAAHDIDYSTKEPRRLQPGFVGFLASPGSHDDFVTEAWVPSPLQWVLTRIAGKD